MSLATIVSKGIATVKKVTSSLQVDVTFRAWTGTDRTGGPTYDDVSLPALVEMKQQLVRSFEGDMVMSKSRVTFIQPITGNGAEGRREPVDPRDELILPDGSKGTLLGVEGLIDPSTGSHYMFQVFLG